MRLAIIIPLLFSVVIAHAQLVPAQTHMDIGRVEDEVHELYIPFVFTNQGERKEYVLKVEPRNNTVHYLKPKTAITPGNSDTLKIYYDPEHKGTFNEDIVVYVSSSTTPMHISITGTLTNVSPDPTLTCYDFKHKTVTKHALDKPIHCYVLDSSTHRPIGKALVSVSSLQGLKGNLQTDRKGSVLLEISPDQYYFHALAAGYKPARKDIYLNHRSADVIIYLASVKDTISRIKTNTFKYPVVKDSAALPDAIAQRPVEHTKPEAENTEDSISRIKTSAFTYPQINDSTSMPDEIAQRPVINTIPKGDTLELADNTPSVKYSGELDPEMYKANNIVFVIDVSGSMGLLHKMDYLKTAMKTLTGQLRSFDKITLIYFSSDARVVLPTTYATDTGRIDSIINHIVIGGTTSANKALLKAHDIVTKEYVQDANNQVILATDGIFSYDDKIVQLYKNSSEPIQFTIVGLAPDRESDRNLNSLSKSLNGDFVNVFKQKEIRRALLEEIKKRSALDSNN